MLRVTRSTTIISIFTPYSAGIDFRRQILTSKVDPRTVRVQTSIWADFPVAGSDSGMTMYTLIMTRGYMLHIAA